MDGGPVKPNLTHIALHVQDLDASVDFYRDYCGLQIVHDRLDHGKHIVWMAEAGREQDFVLVIIPGGPGRNQPSNDYSHFGFALTSADAVDDIATKACAAGFLLWEPRSEPFPVGYYCGIRDPDGNAVEFSYGQPLGPGSPSLKQKK